MNIEDFKGGSQTNNLADSIRLWNSMSISLCDIRHQWISPEEVTKKYRLPASAFIYTGSGQAEVCLNDMVYSTPGFGIFHGGKGTELSIMAMNSLLEYYMILYKAVEPLTHKREFNQLLAHTNPFRQQYGFTLGNPIFFMEQLYKMYERWQGPTPLDLFYGKTAFYQLVYETYAELSKGNIQVFQPDVLAMAKRYIFEHYNDPISIQNVADTIGISAGHFRSSFKSKYGCSPQDFITCLKLKSAKKMLLNPSYKLKEIAEYTGFYDEYHFSKLFKKYEGVSPLSYREYAIRTENIFDSYIGNGSSLSYNEKSRVSLDKLNREGAIHMLKKMRGKAVVAEALSLMMLLSACGTTPTDNSGTSFAPEVTSQAEEGTRTISTIIGDVEVPMNPQRVIHTYALGDMIALGVTPAATFNAAGKAYENEVAGLPVYTSLDAEEFMTFNPDLIIVAGEDAYNMISKVAPTVIIPIYDITLEERITFLGEVLNKQDEAKKALADFNEKILEAKNLLKEKELDTKTFSVFEADSDGIYVFGDKYGRGGDIIYNHLDLKAPEIVENELIAKEQCRDVSLEVLHEYAGDYIIFSGDISIVEDNPVWNSIPAVQAGNIILIDFMLFYDLDLYSSFTQLEFLMDALAGE